MEVLKLVRELAAMATHLRVSTLSHFFDSYDPSTSKDLFQAIYYFQTSSIESSDYRSAYHMTQDWLYGWNVSDASDFEDGVKEYFQKTRVPREIQLKDVWEREEIDKIMKTFETLFNMTARFLSKEYMEIEELVPNVGKGLGVNSQENAGIDDGTDRPALQRKIFDNFVVKQRQEEGKDGGSQNASQDWSKDINPEVKRSLETAQTDDSHRRTSITSPAGRRSSIITCRRASAAFPTGVYDSDSEDEARMGHIETAKQPHKLNPDIPRTEAKGNMDGKSYVREDSGNPGGMAGFTMSLYRPDIQGLAVEDADDELKREKYVLALRHDISLIHVRLEKCVDLTLLLLVIILIILSMSELLNNMEVHRKYRLIANDLSMDFVKRSLKVLLDMLRLEDENATLEDVRDMARLRYRIQGITEARAVNGKIPKLRIRKLPAKISTLHTLFTCLDIHVLPNFVYSHQNGLRSICPSIFDPSIWLTGGNDCTIKIHDLTRGKKENERFLGLYVGHKSIVTFVKFIRADSMVVSASFDRTIKIWNATSATCEKTLVGHTDAILCCDVSPDGKYIISGSADSTVRLWEVGTGECVNIVRKHLRWVKAVRYSTDGKMVATGGLDRRIYVWESRMMIASRAVLPVRCFENHNDYILDLAFGLNGYLYSTSRDMTVRVMNLDDGMEIDLISTIPSWANTIAISANGEYFVTGSFDNNIHIYSTKTRERIRTLRVFNMGILNIWLVPDLSRVMVGTAEGYLQEIPL